MIIAIGMSAEELHRTHVDFVVHQCTHGVRLLFTLTVGTLPSSAPYDETLAVFPTSAILNTCNTVQLKVMTRNGISFLDAPLLQRLWQEIAKNHTLQYDNYLCWRNKTLTAFRQK